MTDELINLTKGLLKIPSITPDTKVAFDYMEDYFTKAGFSTRRMPMSNDEGLNIDNLYAKIGNGSPHIVFAGHLDVVPPGDESKWQSHPFAAEQDVDTIIARGAVDMKSAVTCFAHAAKRFFNDNPSFKGSISLILAGDEEQPVIKGTKNMLEILDKEGEKWDFCIVGEPSCAENVGDTIKIGRRGLLEVYIESFGLQGHTAYGHLADNALHNLVNLLQKIINHKLDNGTDHFQASSIETSYFNVNNDVVGIIPDYSKTGIDIRYNTEQTEDTLREVIDGYIANTKGNFKVEYNNLGDCFLTDKHPYTKLLKDIIKTETGLVADEVTTGGTSDGRFVKDYCPIVEFGLINKTIHKVNEQTEISDIVTLEKIYYEFLDKIFN